MKRLIRASVSRRLNEDELDYLSAKLVEEVEKIFPEYDVDDINREGNRIGFGLYDEYGEEHGHYIWSYRPDFEDGPEEQLDEWLDDFKYEVGR